MNAITRAILMLKTSPVLVQAKREIHPRYGHVVHLPPAVKVPTAEKILLATFLFCSILSIPTWVMYNLEYYKTGGVRTQPGENAREVDTRTETVLELAEQNEVAHGRK